jgi:hypothetical protein
LTVKLIIFQSPPPPDRGPRRQRPSSVDGRGHLREPAPVGPPLAKLPRLCRQEPGDAARQAASPGQGPRSHARSKRQSNFTRA